MWATRSGLVSHIHRAQLIEYKRRPPHYFPSRGTVEMNDASDASIEDGVDDVRDDIPESGPLPPLPLLLMPPYEPPLTPPYDPLAPLLLLLPPPLLLLLLEPAGEPAAPGTAKNAETEDMRLATAGGGAAMPARSLDAGGTVKKSATTAERRSCGG